MNSFNFNETRRCEYRAQIGRPPPPATFDLSIFSIDGTPVESARVTPAQASESTDASGRVSIDELAAGRFVALIEADGFAPATALVEQPCGEGPGRGVPPTRCAPFARIGPNTTTHKFTTRGITMKRFHIQNARRQERRLLPDREIIGEAHLLPTSLPLRRTMRKTFEFSLKRQVLSLATLLLLSLAACGGEPGKDSVICCELADGTVSSETTSDCKEAGGDQVDDELCACDEEVCCAKEDGTFQTLPESQCENLAPPERCLAADADVCCKLDGGFQSVPAIQCPAGQAVAADMCVEEEVCCKLDDGTFQTLPASQCDSIPADPELCLDEEVCCRIDGQFVNVPAGQCPDGSLAPADMCVEEDVCCKLDDGTFQSLPASQCDSVPADPVLCLDEEVCCRIDGQFVTVPAGQCPAGSLAPADMCVEDSEVCCETAAGYVTIPGSQCPAGQESSADMCVEVCCETEAGAQVLAAGECPQAQTISDDICAQEVCCETVDGYETLPQSSCPALQITNSLMCEEEVCCRTAAGNAYVPASQCEPMSVLAEERCVTPPTECVKFRAVDMSALPYTTTHGDTLQSFTSYWGTFPAQASWSSTCLDLPAGTQRAVTGVGNDLVLNFAAPVSSIFLLRFHAQPGDDLIVPGANLTATSCGASTYHNITKVDLTTPSTTVTVQDIDPDGGSGYSVLLAECVEWAQN